MSLFCCNVCGYPLNDDKLLEGYSTVWVCCGQQWTIPTFREGFRK